MGLSRVKRLSATALAITVLFLTVRPSSAAPAPTAVIGGAVTTLATSGGSVYAGAGARMLVFAPEGAGYRQVGATTPLPDLVRGIAVQNGQALVAAGSAGLWIFDVSQPGNPPAIGSFRTPGYAEGVASTGKVALVADGPLGLRIVDISNPGQVAEMGWAFEGKQAMAVAVRDHYALVAAGGAGLLVADIANPARPVELASLPMYGYTTGLVQSGDFIFVMNSWGGIGVVNIANPAEPVLVATCPTPGWAMKASIAGTTMAVADAYHGVRVLDISDPAHPTETGASDTELGDALDVAMDGERIWVADRHEGLAAIAGAPDFTRTPVYDTFSRTWTVAISGHYAYVAAMERGLRIIDISDPADPREVGVYPVCNAVAVTINGQYAYLSVFFGAETSGFHVVDISDPRNPKRAGFLQTATQLPMNVPRDHTSVGAISYVTNEVGLIIIDASDPANPVVASFVKPPPGQATLGVTVRDNLAYVAREYGGLVVFDVSDPRAPKFLGMDPGAGSGQDVALSGNYALIVGLNNMAVEDVSDPAHPRLVSSNPLSGRGITVNGSVAYVGTTGAGIRVLDIGNPTAPSQIGSYRTAGYARKAVVEGDRLWIADAEAGLWSVPLASISGAGTVTANSPLPRVRTPAAPAAQAPAAIASVHPVPRAAVPVLAAAKRRASVAPRAEGGTCVVTNAGDSGSGTLRNCLESAVQGGTITFDPATFPPQRPRIIRVQSPLPPLTQGSLTIDGSSAGVRLDGSAVGADGHCFVVLSDSNTIRGLGLEHFSGASILLTGGATGNVIGGDRSQGAGPQGQGNTISDSGPGVAISGVGTSNNVVIGNYFNTSLDGMQATGSGPRINGTQHSPVEIGAGATANTIGGSTSAERNVIQGGLLITGRGTTDNAVTGNYIGVNASGDGLFRCGDSVCPSGGLVVIADHAARNRIGGSRPGEGNLINDGNYGVIVVDYGTIDNQIVGNYIGVDATGTVSLSNLAGVWFDGGPRATLVAGNVISPRYSASIGTAGDYNVVIGNRLGTDASGMTAIAPGGLLSANMFTRRNRIGGAAPGEANLSAGSIWLAAPGTESNYVSGNLIGTDATGTALFAGASPTASGVIIGDGAKRNVVGGSVDAEANLIAGAARDGIVVGVEGVSYNFIGRNWVGDSPTGSPSLGNRGDGIFVNGADHTFILGNRIAFSGKSAVWIQGMATTVRGNAIHDNHSGIELAVPEPPFPRIASVTATAVSGTACPNCTVEVFSDTGNQGGRFEGAVRADAKGAFTLAKPGGFLGPNLTATATDANGLTSRFSAPEKK